MTNDSIRHLCLALPHVTEVLQWESHLLFKVGGKMFAMIDLDGHSCNVKCTPERYSELIEMEDIVPTPYNMWKYGWVTLQTLSAVSDREMRDLLSTAYELVRASLPKRVQAELSGDAPPAKKMKEGTTRRRSGGARTKTLAVTKV